MKKIVDHYINEYRAGRNDDAFHGLINQASEIIPELISVYETSNDLDVKVFIIEVISEFRMPSSLGFLRQALCREEECIWKSALDGLAMAESIDAVDVMGHVLVSVADENKRDWILEAMSEMSPRVKSQGKSQEIPIPNPPLSPAEKAIADSLGKDELAIIDSCILSHCSYRQLKVARIVIETERDLADRFPGLSYIFYTLRLQYLVREGSLEGFGDLRCVRFSEVRLPASKNT